MTTAASTGFATQTITGPKGYRLHFDGNQKITAGNGSYETPKANAFSLPQVITCPSRTPTCEASCYVHNLETHQGWLHDLYKENLRTITHALRQQESWPGVYPSSADNWADLVALWIAQHCDGGFRWHVSGDLFSVEYARWIGQVVDRVQLENPNVKHWIYTRSFDMIGPLLTAAGHRGRPQLTVNLSADVDNYHRARATEQFYRITSGVSMRVCYLTVDGTTPPDLREHDVIFPNYSLRAVDERGKQRPHVWRGGSPFWNNLPKSRRRMVCPADAYGKSENNRCGPCSRCLGTVTV